MYLLKALSYDDTIEKCINHTELTEALLRILFLNAMIYHSFQNY